MFKIVNNIKTHGFLLVAIAIFGVIGLNSISSDTALAANTKNRMLGVAAICSNLKDNNEGTNHKFLCEPVEKKLKDHAGCEAVTYAITINTSDIDDSVTEKRWFIKPSAYKACYDKVEAMLKRFESGNCVLGEWNGSSNRTNCQDRDDDLSEILGCSNDLIRKSGSVYRAKPEAVKECRSKLDVIGNLKLPLGNPDGTTRVSTVAVKDIGTDADTEGLGNNAASDEEESSAAVNCQGGPMGWLFCPMINYMTSTLQTLARLIDDLMQVKFLAQDGSSKSIESAWRAFLSIANIMLVIAFMVIVFSQSTGAGLNNYNIKRMLPRLVIAAVLMNISFYICALAIDVSNIVGASIMGLFIGGGSVGDAITNATGGPGGKGILGGALTGALLIGLLLFILTPVILSIIIVFVCLVARQLILICLILASPIAFVAWLLPNTEQYFKKWYSLFFQMLILYPAVMFIFGASLYFAKFLGAGGQGIDIATTSGSDPDDGLNDILTQIIQLIVLCIPLVALPLLIKGSSNIMGKIGGYANQAGLKGVGGAKGAGKMGMKGGRRNPLTRGAFEMMDQRKENMEAARKKGALGRAAGRTGSFKRRVVGGVGVTATSRDALNSLDGRAQSQIISLDEQEVKEASAAIGLSSDFMKASEAEQLGQLKTLVRSEDTTTARAAAKMLATRGAPGLTALKEFAQDGSVNSETRGSVARELRGDHRDTLEQKMPELLHGFAKDGGANPTGVEEALEKESTWAKVTASNIDQLDDKSLSKGIEKNGIDRDTLMQVQNDQQAWSKLPPAKRVIINNALGNNGPQSAGGTNTPPPAPTSGGTQIRGGSGTGTGGGSVSWTPKK